MADKALKHALATGKNPDMRTSPIFVDSSDDNDSDS